MDSWVHLMARGGHGSLPRRGRIKVQRELQVGKDAIRIFPHFLRFWTVCPVTFRAYTTFFSRLSQKCSRVLFPSHVPGLPSGIPSPPLSCLPCMHRWATVREKWQDQVDDSAGEVAGPCGGGPKGEGSRGSYAGPNVCILTKHL